jgi:hypothetical protein
MALKIKAGSKIYAYGAACKPFTEDSKLSQAILEHLKSRFPEDIEEIKEIKETKEIKKPLKNK